MIALNDDHLRSGDFLDTDHHATMTFTSTGVEQIGRTGFKGSAIINRHGWGVSWDGRLIGRKVVLELDVAVIRRSWPTDVPECERPVGFRVSVRP
ncbi:YceI-like domain-containing protein [Streptomyces sp. cf386]|uniref:YceI family protein n=1 Tax=Streptomyces sp. cf386 TaxID=1761904 RepID=UPI0008913D8B|nr:YceI family protein [Streptomyces sp. cf386]SDM96628.1 YceI-like domain-containing protein [Streptomyces sp. cf386]